MALMQGMTFPLQAVVGGLLVWLLSMAGVTLFPTIGLTFAAAGYFCSFFVGVPLVNPGIRRGQAAHGAHRLPQEIVTGLLPREATMPSAGHLTLHSGNADTMAFQMALVGIVYGITYGLVRLLGLLMPADAAAMLWGFFFFFALGMALMVRKGMQALGVDYLANGGIQRRITGWSVDYLIVATVAAIQLKIVWQYWMPISLIAVANGILTTCLVVWFGRRLAVFSLERTAAIYGTVTGTVSCGLLLLRICDPEFRTPAALEMALMNVLVLPIVGGCTLMVNAPLWWGWSVGLTLAVFAGIFSLSLGTMILSGYVASGSASESDT